MNGVADLLVHGLHSSDLGLLADRLAVGGFFVVSGYHKLFHPTRRATLLDTFKQDGLGRLTPAMMWAVPVGELAGGLGVAAGALTVVAAMGLVALCFGACFLDGLKRIPGWKPLDAADYAADVLYLPEVLYMALLGLLIASGPGVWSLDILVLS